MALRAIRVLGQAQSAWRVRPFLQRQGTTAAAAGYDDIVKDLFIKQQQQFRGLLNEYKTISIPLDPDDEKAVKEYAAALKAARQKVGVLSQTERAGALIDGLLAESPDMRSFIEGYGKLRKDLGFDDSDGVETLALKALDTVEKKLGKPLSKEDQKGLASLRAELDAIGDKLGVIPSTDAQLEAEVEVAVAKQQVAEMRAQALKRIEDAKRNFGLDVVQVDLKTFDPRPYL